MIETLRIENLALVESAELEFGPGLNVLTGETGAGKSIVLSSLALLAGARVAGGTLREGAKEGSVEALFRTDRLGELLTDLQERGLVAEDPDDPARHELVVRRSLAGSGRTRARVGGQLVPASTLSDLFEGRLEISSQHGSQALRRSETHGLLLDEASGRPRATRELREARR